METVKRVMSTDIEAVKPQQTAPYFEFMDFMTQLSLVEQNELILQLLNDLETGRMARQKQAEDTFKQFQDANKIFDQIRSR